MKNQQQRRTSKGIGGEEGRKRKSWLCFLLTHFAGGVQGKHQVQDIFVISFLALG